MGNMANLISHNSIILSNNKLDRPFIFMMQ